MSGATGLVTGLGIRWRRVTPTPYKGAPDPPAVRTGRPPGGHPVAADRDDPAGRSRRGYPCRSWTTRRSWWWPSRPRLLAVVALVGRRDSRSCASRRCAATSGSSAATGRPTSPGSPRSRRAGSTGSARGGRAARARRRHGGRHPPEPASRRRRALRRLRRHGRPALLLRRRRRRPRRRHRDQLDPRPGRVAHLRQGDRRPLLEHHADAGGAAGARLRDEAGGRARRPAPTDPRMPRDPSDPGPAPPLRLPRSAGDVHADGPRRVGRCGRRASRCPSRPSTPRSPRCATAGSTPRWCPSRTRSRAGCPRRSTPSRRATRSSSSVRCSSRSRSCSAPEQVCRSAGFAPSAPTRTRGRRCAAGWTGTSRTRSTCRPCPRRRARRPWAPRVR